MNVFAVRVLGLEPDDLADGGAPDHAVGVDALGESFKDAGGIVAGLLLLLLERLGCCHLERDCLDALPLSVRNVLDLHCLGDGIDGLVWLYIRPNLLRALLHEVSVLLSSKRLLVQLDPLLDFVWKEELKLC